MLHRAYVSSEKSILRMVAAAAAVADNNLQQRRSAKPPKHETTVAGNIFSSAFEQHDNRIGDSRNPEWAATIVAASRITKQRGRRKRTAHSNVFLWLFLCLVLLLLFLAVVVVWVIVYHAVLVRETTTQHSTAVYLASPKAISQPTTDTFRWDASSDVLGAPPPDDAILGIAMAYQACTNPHKVHVAVGAYRTCAHIHT